MIEAVAMKIQDLTFLMTLFFSLVLVKSGRLFIALGLLELIAAFFAFKVGILFTGERLTWYGAGFILVGLSKAVIGFSRARGGRSVRKLTRNTLWLLGSQFFSKTIGFGYVLYLARRLGVAGFGQYQAVLALVFVFFTLVDFGLNRLLIRDLSRKPNQASSYLSNALGFRLILAGIAYLLILAMALLFGYSPLTVRLITLTALIFFAQGFWFCFDAVFLAREMMAVSALGTILLAIANPFLGIFLLKAGWGVAGVLAGTVFSSLVTLLFLGGLAQRKGINWRFSFERVFLNRFLKEGGKFAWLTIFSLIYLKNGIIILGWLKGEEAVGLYSAAYKIVEVGILFPNALALAFFPQIARLVISQKKKLIGLYRRLAVTALLLALPLAGIVSRYPKQSLALFFGTEYAQASAAFSVLGLSLLLFFVNALPGNIIQASKKLASFLPWAGLNTGLNVLLNLFLISRFSFLGAAYAILITEMTGLVINNVFVFKILKKGK